LFCIIEEIRNRQLSEVRLLQHFLQLRKLIRAPRKDLAGHMWLTGHMLCRPDLDFGALQKGLPTFLLLSILGNHPDPLSLHKEPSFSNVLCRAFSKFVLQLLLVLNLIQLYYLV